MKICDVEFDIPTEPVGLLCSGGPDSSLILYLLMKYCNQPIHVITVSYKKQHYANCFVMSDVLKWCIDKTNNMNIIHYNWFCYDATNLELAALPSQLLKDKKISSLIIGDTCWPPKELQETFVANGYDTIQTGDDREPDVTRPTRVKNFYFPFTNYSKQKIAEIYEYENIMDLFPLTRSCGSYEDIGKVSCGKCWWCHERIWAFGKL